MLSPSIRSNGVATLNMIFVADIYLWFGNLKAKTHNVINGADL
mgnify:CR=1 FL=1